MPGGVSSPVRAFKSVGGNPIVFERVKGAYAWDVDGWVSEFLSTHMTCTLGCCTATVSWMCMQIK